MNKPKNTPSQLRKERTDLINKINETARIYLENIKEKTGESSKEFGDDEYTTVHTYVNYTDDEVSCRVVAVALTDSGILVNLHDDMADTYIERYLEYLSIDEQLDILDEIAEDENA